MSKKAILIIMDGWGHGKVPAADAIAHANAPFVKSLYARYPNTELITCGEAVGLPDGQMGNSEVGHLNIGAGRIVYQELERINVAIKDGELERSHVLNAAFNAVKGPGKTLHFMGLVAQTACRIAYKHYLTGTELTPIIERENHDDQCPPALGPDHPVPCQNSTEQWRAARQRDACTRRSFAALCDGCVRQRLVSRRRNPGLQTSRRALNASRSIEAKACRFCCNIEDEKGLKRKFQPFAFVRLAANPGLVTRCFAARRNATLAASIEARSRTPVNPPWIRCPIRFP